MNPWRLSVGMSAEDAVIQKRIYGSVCPLDLALHIAELIIWNEEM